MLATVNAKHTDLITIMDTNEYLYANYSPFSSKDFTKLDRNWSQFPGLSYTFEWEHKLLDHLDSMRNYVREHYLLPVALSAVYCIMLNPIQKWMQNRPAYNLRVPLLLWNTTLAVFSIFGSVRVWPELLWMMRYQGLFKSTCDHRYINDSRLFLWIYLFTFSKILEFGDTMFILLRKQKLLTLHWIHHAWTLIYCWYCMFHLPAHARWLCSMNFAVHSIMYSYYAVMASGVRVPKWAAQLITLTQIIQMTCGLYIQAQALWLTEAKCDVPFNMAALGLSMYGTFWALFIKFFFDKYFGTNGKKQRKIVKQE